MSPLPCSPSPFVLRAIGCLDPQCHLCQYNPARRCMVNFNPRYLVGDPLRAKCGSSIRIEVQDRFTSQPYEEEIPGLKLEVYLLDGHQYETQQVVSMSHYPHDPFTLTPPFLSSPLFSSPPS